MVNLDFTDHARDQMDYRRISEAEVREAVTDPDSTVPADSGSEGRMKTIGGRLITVMVDPFTDPLVIITVMEDPV